ncbi:MAG: beta-phosphoglucomutase family hydrolase [Bacteroidales bacterium]|nr:beta-phosphoglucomutase family hydrolase [Bacteroidales bacterium]
MLKFDAVIFDLDGVITKTALVHGNAWKRMFDDFLRDWSGRNNVPFREFTHTEDYLPYVDGKPRYKGVASFLESRGIELEYGDPSDDPSMETVCALGNRKNILFNKVLDEDGVEVYDSSVKMIHSLQKLGIRIGVASSSKNCKPVLEAAGLLDLFETRIDGVVSAELGLHGKPEPDIFTTACDRLGVEYHRSVVVEDAVSGVQAGRNGNFGLVIGVAREDNVDELKINGGDIVVEDLAEISITDINDWFERDMEEASWFLKYFDYNPGKERSREALLAVGNGYFATRGALEESRANRVNYPGTYISGLYNRLVSKVGDRDIENEDFVNIPNWLLVRFRIGEGEWLSFNPEPGMAIRKVLRRLNFKNGELYREIEFEDDEGRITLIRSSRFAGMHYKHIAGLKYTLTPLNYSGQISFRSELDGNHINAGVERYSALKQEQLSHVSERIDGNRSYLEVKTTESNVIIKLGARHIVNGSEDLDEIMNCECSRGKACQDFTLEASQGEEISLEKLVSIYTSQDKKVTIPKKHARKALDKMTDYSGELELSGRAWQKIWDEIDIKVEGDRAAQKLIRLHLYHMMVTASPHHRDLDAGIPPRGLHGEAYRGHIFWDELYILPLYNIHFPGVVRSVLMYRFRRLDRAKDMARENACKGAMYPWQSGSDGREETQVLHLNPVSGEWGDDYSRLQRHVSLAIAYNIYNYYRVSGDREFMMKYGAEMLLEISRFWESKCEYDRGKERYNIHKVMGPDEFHEKLPGATEGGLSNNAYTNIMVSWMMCRLVSFIESLDEEEKDKMFEKYALSPEEIEHWKDISARLSLSINDEGIIEQFDGYFDLEELDWDAYREKYGDIHRLDRILKAEGKAPDDYKLAKQADLLMVFYNLGFEKADDIIRRLGYKLPDDYIRKNFDYYIAHTSHGSTLSRLVHSNLAYRLGDHELGWDMYMEALSSDLEDIQGGTTGEGIHCGVMAGTVYMVLSVFCGLDLSGEEPVLCPDIPQHWKGVKFNFMFRETHFKVAVLKNTLEIIADSSRKNKIMVHICGEKIKLERGRMFKMNLKK